MCRLPHLCPLPLASMEHRPAGRVFTDYYCPLEAGYKDRSGVLPYDRAAARAISATYTPPLQGAAEAGRSLFVSRLPRDAEEADLEKVSQRRLLFYPGLDGCMLKLSYFYYYFWYVIRTFHVREKITRFSANQLLSTLIPVFVVVFR